jgi:hypothetical protein
VDGIRWVVEQAPVPDGDGWARGAVREAPVGARALGRLRMFRYEIRCWQDGSIPDVGEAVGTVRWNDAAAARRVLALVPEVPPLVWGRDEVGAGDMWTSNGIVAWLLASAGLDAAAVQPPAGGRAPGWSAGVAVARRRVVACG